MSSVFDTFIHSVALFCPACYTDCTNKHIKMIGGDALANNYPQEPRVPGATPEEKAMLEKEIAREVMREARVSKAMYYKFRNGEPVVHFVRERIMQYLYNKHTELGNAYKKLIKLSKMDTKAKKE